MSTKNRFQKRARLIQKETGWSYSECLRLSREEITVEALDILKKLRSSIKNRERRSDNRE